MTLGKNNGKTIAQKLFDVIGGNPKVIRYHDNDNVSIIDLFISSDMPFNDVNTYSTIGLSDYSISMNTNDGRELRVEFIGSCKNTADKFANIISSCAFNIINNKYSCKPGTVYPGVVKEYYPDIEMQHIYFSAPFLWENLDNIIFDDKVITWLMAIPISNNEFEFLKTNGDEVLEVSLEKHDVDFCDIFRKSVI